MLLIDELLLYNNYFGRKCVIFLEKFRSRHNFPIENSWLRQWFH